MSEPPAEKADRLYGRRSRPGEERELEAIVARASKAIVRHLAPTMPGVSVFHFGALDYFPGSLGIWVRTKTDAQRDTLLGDSARFEILRTLLGAAGYPSECLSFVGFTAESDQTVERDYGGDWYRRVK